MSFSTHERHLSFFSAILKGKQLKLTLTGMNPTFAGFYTPSKPQTVLPSYHMLAESFPDVCLPS